MERKTIKGINSVIVKSQVMFNNLPQQLNPIQTQVASANRGTSNQNNLINIKRQSGIPLLVPNSEVVKFVGAKADNNSQTKKGPKQLGGAGIPKRKRNRKKKGPNITWSKGKPSINTGPKSNPNANTIRPLMQLPFDTNKTQASSSKQSQEPRSTVNLNTNIQPNLGFQNIESNKQNSGKKRMETIMTPGFSFDDSPRYVQMQVGDTIYLDTYSKQIYEPNNTDLNQKTLSRPDMWHQFIVHHNGKFKKGEILSALFKLVPLNEIFPIGYRSFAQFDSFLLTVSDKAAIDILVRNNLTLNVNNRNLGISVRLGAGQIVMGQVHPQTQIILVCKELLEKAFLYGNNQIVDLEGFEKHPALAEVEISMRNQYHLVTIIKGLQENEAAAKSLKGIKLSNCRIQHLDSLRFLVPFESLSILDLRNNRISSVLEFKHLEKLKITRLYIAGNPFTETEEQTYIQERIKRMIPTLKYLDDLELQTVKIKEEPGVSNSQDLYFDIMFDGEPIRAHDDLNPNLFKQKYKASNYWHKVIVHHNGKLNRKQVVSKLLNLVDNTDLWPCYYQSFENYDEFYVHNNLDALEILVRNQLVMKIHGSDDVITIKLQMNVAPFKVGQVDVVEKIQKVCLEQFINKTLYLNSLAERETFSNVIIDMSSPRVVSQILLWASRKCGSTCVSLNLNNNGLVSCNGMYPLVYFQKLKDLNLRNNRIESFERLSGIPQGNKVTSVFLEGNPLCNTSLHQYIRNAKHFFTELETLDGIALGDELYMLSRQNFLCTPEAYMFVESFVKHYFSIYESNQRHLLKNFYADTALFSLSNNFDGQRNKEVVRASKYTAKSRNITRIMNFDQASKNVFIGSEEIMKAILDLHSVEYDYLSFNIDVPLFTEHSALIIVNGILKDKPLQFLDAEFLLDFTRVFYIKAGNTGMGVSGMSTEFKIHNDMLTVRNVTISQKSNAFQPAIKEPPNEESNDTERDSIIVIFQELTKLNRQWCFKFLDEAKWNFKIALNICVKLLEDDKIPNDAFETRFGV